MEQIFFSNSSRNINCSKTDFICYKVNSLSNNKKQVIYGNNGAGPHLPTNVVSVMQCVFGLLSATKLELNCF